MPPEVKWLSLNYFQCLLIKVFLLLTHVVFHVVVDVSNINVLVGMVSVDLSIPVATVISFPHSVCIGSSSSLATDVSVGRDFTEVLVRIVAAAGSSVVAVSGIVIAWVAQNVGKAVIVGTVRVGRWSRWNVWLVVLGSFGVISYWGLNLG